MRSLQNYISLSFSMWRNNFICCAKVQTSLIVYCISVLGWLLFVFSCFIFFLENPTIQNTQLLTNSLSLLIVKTSISFANSLFISTRIVSFVILFYFLFPWKGRRFYENHSLLGNVKVLFPKRHYYALEIIYSKFCIWQNYFTISF